MKRLYGYNIYAIDSHDIYGDYLIAKDISNFNGIKTKRKHILTKVKNEEAEIRQDNIELVGTIIGHKSIAEFEYNKTTTNKVYLSFKGILFYLKIQPQDSTKPGYFLLHHNRAEEYNNMFVCSADGNYYPAKELYWMTHKIGKESYYVDYAGHTTDSRTNREGDAFVLHIYIPFTDKQYLKDKADHLVSCLNAASSIEAVKSIHDPFMDRFMRMAQKDGLVPNINDPYNIYDKLKKKAFNVANNYVMDYYNKREMDKMLTIKAMKEFEEAI